MQKLYKILVLLLILLLPGCANRSQQTQVTNAAGAICPLPVPATYTADIPCRECQPTSASLTLRPDALYFLRITSRDADTGARVVRAEMGVWKYIAAGNTILLNTYDNAARTLVITGSGQLRVVRVSGGIIPPDVNYDLVLSEGGSVYTDLVRVQGMYSYREGSGVFNECLTGAAFPVADEEENAALERAYMNTPHGQLEPILVTLDARLSSNLRVGAMKYEEVLVPARFINIRPGIGCDGGKSSRLTLVDNSWHLKTLAGKPVELDEDQKAPYFSLKTEGNRLEAFAGCNRISGTYLVKGELFFFNKVIERRMACAKGIELEFAFLNVLKHTERYRIKGEILELRDREGKPLATFQYAGGI
jgi:heat shock protein HslJ